MPTDDERREVARRLRSFVTDDSVNATVDASNVLYVLGLHYADIDRICFCGYDVARLADLIEPSCDRGALLRLARYMDKDVAETEAHFSNVISTKSVSDYARRIREALGVES